jgi:hypothetical protein
MTPSARVATIVAVPPVCVGVLWVSVLAIAGITGTHPIWDLQPRNLAEAAAFRDGAAVVRFAAYDDINKASEVRGNVIGVATGPLTPIEAAAASRAREMVQLVLDQGASPDAVVWRRAFCISDADDVRAVLAEHRPPDARDDCATD